VKIVLPLIILALAAAGFAGLKASKPRAEGVAAEERAWTVATQLVRPGRHRPELLLHGHVEPLRLARLSPALSADVLEVLVREGDTVEAGQVLLRLDRRDAELLLAQRQADVAEIEADIESERLRHENDLAALPREQELLVLSRREADRARDLAKKKVGPQSLLDDARSKVQRQSLTLLARRHAVREHQARMARLQARKQRAEALRDRAALDLERTLLRAPFDGRVALVAAAPGSRVGPNDVVIEIYDHRSLEVRVQIPSRYMAQVRAAHRSGELLRAEAVDEGRRIGAELVTLAGRVNRDSGGVEALFRLDEGADWLPLNRYLRLRLKLPEREGLVALPFEALYGSDRIYRVRDGRMQALKVERVGETRGDGGERLLLVRSGELRDGDRVVVTHLPNAMDGLLVKVVDSSGGQPR